MGSPGDYEKEHPYEALIASVSPLQIADIAKWSKVTDEKWGNAEVPVWLLSPTGELISCTAHYVSDLVGARAVPDPLGLRGGEVPGAGGLGHDPIPAHSVTTLQAGS